VGGPAQARRTTGRATRASQSSLPKGERPCSNSTRHDLNSSPLDSCLCFPGGRDHQLTPLGHHQVTYHIISNGGTTSMTANGVHVNLQGSMAGRCASLSSSTAPLARCATTSRCRSSSLPHSLGFGAGSVTWALTNCSMRVTPRTPAGSTVRFAVMRTVIGTCLHHGATRIISVN
jgi:hypothetical protein